MWYMACYLAPLLVPTDASSAELMERPFQCCVLPDFVDDNSGDFLKGLKAELLGLEFYEKNNDLYQFSQVRLRVALATVF